MALDSTLPSKEMEEIPHVKAITLAEIRVLGRELRESSANPTTLQALRGAEKLAGAITKGLEVRVHGAMHATERTVKSGRSVRSGILAGFTFSQSLKSDKPTRVTDCTD